MWLPGIQSRAGGSTAGNGVVANWRSSVTRGIFKVKKVL